MGEEGKVLIGEHEWHAVLAAGDEVDICVLGRGGAHHGAAVYENGGLRFSSPKDTVQGAVYLELLRLASELKEAEEAIRQAKSLPFPCELNTAAEDDAALAEHERWIALPAVQRALGRGEGR